MPVIKVRENEPFDVALRRFKRSCEKPVSCPKFVAVSSTRSRLPFVSAPKRLLLSVTPRSCLAKTHVVSACTNQGTVPCL